MRCEPSCVLADYTASNVFPESIAIDRTLCEMRTRKKTLVRVKVAETVVLCAMNMFVGSITSVIAATLFDIATQTNVTVDKAAMLISWLFIGRLPGILFSSLVLDRVSGESALIAASLLLSILFCAIPQCNSYSSMAGVIALTGAGTGFMGVGMNRFCFSTWSNPIDRQVVMLINFFFAVGSAAGPQLANLFICAFNSTTAYSNVVAKNHTDYRIPVVSRHSVLSDRNSINSNELPSLTDETHFMETGTVMFAVSGRSSMSTHLLADFQSLLSVNLNRTQQEVFTLPTAVCSDFYKAYVVVSGCQLTCCVALVVVFLMSVFRWHRRHSTAKEHRADKLRDVRDVDCNDNERETVLKSREDRIESISSSARHPMCGATVALRLSTFAAFMFAHANVEMTYGALVLPYCVGRLAMSESAGNSVAFTYWTSYSVGRFVAIFATRPPIGPERLLTGSVILNITSLVALVVTGELTGEVVSDGGRAAWSWPTVVIWPCTAALGLGVSTVFGQTLGLLAVYSSPSASPTSSPSANRGQSTLSARQISVLLFAYAGGCIVGPSAAGALFGRLGVDWLPRYVLGAALMSAIVLTALRWHRCRSESRTVEGTHSSTS